MTDDGNPILVRVPTRPSPYPEAWRERADQLLTDLGFEPGYLSWALARDVVCNAFADAVTRALGPTPSGAAPAAGVTEAREAAGAEAQCSACGAGHEEATERGEVPPIVLWPCGHRLCWHCDRTSRVAPWKCLGCEARAARRGGEG